MALLEIELPQLGETVEEGTITRWFKQVGDTITVDELFYEVSTEKVDAEVPSPVTGTIIELKVAEGETVPVGTVLAVVEGELAASAQATVTPDAAVSAGSDFNNLTKDNSTESDSEPNSIRSNQNTGKGDTERTGIAARRLLSPVVRRLIKEHELDLTQLKGSGLGGRITRNDVLNLIDERHRD